MRSLTRQDVRRIDRFAIETLGVPGVVLMENAGRNAAGAVDEFLGGVAGRRAAIVAGAGNNGGDGFVIARYLSLGGSAVTTFLLAPETKLTADARTHFRILRKMGGQIIDASAAGQFVHRLSGCDVVVDAVGGTGIRGALRGRLAEAIGQINAAGGPVVAVDIPTGLDCDTGQAPGPAVRAQMTVTFLARKVGFDTPGAAAFTGRVRVADIGIPARQIAEMLGIVEAVGDRDAE